MRTRANPAFRVLLLDEGLALGTGERTGAAEQHPQVVVNFGNGAHRATGIVTAGRLVDGHSRLEALDGIDVGAFELVEKLPGVDAQRLDVLPLALGQ